MSSEMLHYEYDGEDAGPGSSLGNGHCWVNIGSDGRIASFFSTDIGQEVAGPLLVRYCSAETRVAEAGVGDSA